MSHFCMSGVGVGKDGSYRAVRYTGSSFYPTANYTVSYLRKVDRAQAWYLTHGDIEVAGSEP